MTSINGSRRKGLSHPESKAQTRANLIAVGRKHFLRHGFKNAIAETIAKEAGYTRGALHSNFGNKEGLLLEVARACNKTSMAAYAAMIDKYSSEKLVRKIREGLGNTLQDPDNLLMTLFEIEAFQNKTLHASFLEFQEEVGADARVLVKKVLDRNPCLYIPIDVADFVIGIDSLRRGLLIRLILPQPDVTRAQSRRILLDYFDQFGFRVNEQPARRKSLTPQIKTRF